MISRHLFAGHFFRIHQGVQGHRRAHQQLVALQHTAIALKLERNRRVLQRYQLLVRTAVTLDALVDAEEVPGKEVS